LLIGGTLIAYLAGLFLLPDRPVFWSPDEGGKYLHMRQIASSHQIANPLPYRGRMLDPGLENVPLLYWLRSGNQILSWWPVWFPAISSWVYRFLGFRGIYLIPVLSSVLLSTMAYWTVSGASKRLALVAMAVTALASPIAFYGLTFWEHTLQSLLVFLAFASIVRGWTTESARWYAASGLFLGLATYLRLETVIYAGAVGMSGVFWIHSRRRARSSAEAVVSRLAVLAACFLVVLVPLMMHNQLNEGHILGRRSALETHKVLSTSLSYGRTSMLETLPDLLFGTPVHGSIDLVPSLRWMFALATIACFVAPWLIRQNLEFVVYLAAVALIALCGIVLFTPTMYISVHGLVLIAPYVVFAGWGLRPSSDQDTLSWGCLSAFGLAAFLLATIISGWEGQGGLQWGPRYALPLFPLLIVAAVRGVRHMVADESIEKATRHALTGCLIILVLLGVGFQARGLLAMFISRHVYAAWEEELEALPNDVIIATDLSWLALTVPDVYETRVMYLMSSEHTPQEDWLRVAQDAGFKHICQVHRASFFDLEVSCSDLSGTGF